MTTVSPVPLAPTRSAFAAIARLEFAEVLRSRWLWLHGSVYAAMVGILVLVGMRESSVLGFTGLGRVVLGLSMALILVLPLLGLTATGQVVNRAREEGSLELLFAHPLRRTTYFGSVALVRTAALAAPLIAVMLLLGVVGTALRQSVPWGYLLRATAVCTALLVASVALGLAISVFVRNQARALMLALFAWALGIALLDFALLGMLLRWQVEPAVVFALAALNPVQDARLALLAGLEPDLATLGPVGFFLSTKVGATGLLVLGIGWPLLLAGACFLSSLQRFQRGDLV